MSFEPHKNEGNLLLAVRHQISLQSLAPNFKGFGFKMGDFENSTGGVTHKNFENNDEEEKKPIVQKR